ncbi:MAG: hypothetical protein LBH24_02285 [Clostridiales bacterium]|nr:hypothetical protein [Clostridiales bacterium]
MTKGAALLLQLVTLSIALAAGLLLRLLLRFASFVGTKTHSLAVVILDTAFTFLAVGGVCLVTVLFHDGVFVPFTAIFFLLGIALPLRRPR